MAPGYIMHPHLSGCDCLGSARQNRGFPFDKNSFLKPINCEQGGPLDKKLRTHPASLISNSDETVPTFGLYNYRRRVAGNPRGMPLLSWKYH
jgi:hypothetical protein